jgi:hypothetical protein
MSNFFPQVLYSAWSVARGDAIILKGNLLSVLSVQAAVPTAAQ